MLRLLVVPGLLLAAVPSSGQTPICSIQGNGASSPMAGQTITAVGIVTAVFPGSGSLQGFFIEDPGCDADNQTSNGIFVYQPGAIPVVPGQRVSVSGTVVEFQGLTEIASVTGITVVGSGSVAPTDVSLPIPSVNDWERFEGMLLRFPQPLIVNGNDDWAQYGELTLAPSRLYHPTETIDPNDPVASGTTSTGGINAAAVNAAVDLQARSAILLDDGMTDSYPDPLPFLGPEGTVRCGSSITGLTGVMHYAFSAYRIQPTGTVPFQHALRPTAPSVGGGLRVASWNVRNYFTTLGSSGAQSPSELARQRTKLVAALQALNADAIVLCEMENNSAAWQDLLTGLNSAVGAGTYSGIDHEAPGSYTRSVIFYKPSVLTAVTATFAINTPTFQRAHLTQGFQVNATGGRFLISTAHLRSKLCNDAFGGNLDQGDGQGCYNALRRSQVQELMGHWSGLRANTFIASQLIVGDFNAYDQEDPMDLLRANGYVDLISALPQPWTYRFGDRFGSLDHAYGTSEMAGAITGAAPWNINSDEPPALDYRSSALFQSGPFRSSDHDPVVVSIDAAMIPTGIPANPEAPIVRFRFDGIQGLAEWEGDEPFTLEVYDAAGRAVILPSQAQGHQRRVRLSGLSAGAYVWRCRTALGSGTALGRFVSP